MIFWLGVTVMVIVCGVILAHEWKVQNGKR